MKRVLIIIPQCRLEPTTYPPYGALQVASYILDRGYEVEILNLDLIRSLSLEEIMDRIRKYEPDVLGFSGILSNNYGYIKKMSLEVRQRWPDLFQVLGGQLTRAEMPVLENIPVDLLVKGEGEITFFEVLETLEHGKMDFESIKGLSYKYDGQIIQTCAPKLIKKLDELPFPHYELIDMSHYCTTPEKRFGTFLGSLEKLDKRFLDPHRQGQKAFTIMTGRGCQMECTFCSRNMRGLRKNSHEYILDHIEYLKDKYNVGFFTFGDESFSPHPRWVREFAEKLIDRKLDILYYVLGNRVDTVNREALQAMKESGCFMVEYGFEHGSQRMLDMMEKRNTVAENFQVYQWTREAGLHTVPSNVINLPGETTESINESIAFLKSLKMSPPSFFVNYAQALPGTPLYDYALATGMITDEDAYLSNNTDVDAADYVEAIKKGVLLNFSGKPLKEVLSWQLKFELEVQMDYLRRQGGLIFYAKFLETFIWRKMLNAYKIYRNKGLRAVLAKLRTLVATLFSTKTTRPCGESSIPVGDQRTYLKQFGNDIMFKEEIKQLKLGRYDEREIEISPQNKYIHKYYDSYNGKTVVRFPSLREITQKMGFWEAHHLKKIKKQKVG